MVYCQHPSHAWGVATAPHQFYCMRGVLLQHPIFNSVGRIMPKTRYLLVYRADIVQSVGRVCVKSTVILKVQGLCTCLLAMWCNL